MEQGLTSAEAQKKQLALGKNEITGTQKQTIFTIFLAQFPSVINGILLIAACLSFIIGDQTDGFLIIAILFLNALFGFAQEYKAEKSLEKLKQFITPAVRVLRDGKEIQLPTIDITVGDLVILSEGEHIPADGTLLTTRELEVDESILTGEALPVLKKQKEILFKGTMLVKGNGHLLVTAIGMQTRFGQIAKTLATIETEKTPLQLRLATLGKILSLLALGTSFLLIPIGLTQGKDLLPLVLLSISIGIAAIPEGLPAVITIALALGTSRMAKKQAIVRRMPAVETLGAIQILLTDKTGTLTQNVMRVKKHWLNKKDHLEDMLLASVLGNTASIASQGTDGAFDVIGDRTDGALLLWAKEQQKDALSLPKKGTIIDEFVFDPATKTVTTVFQQETKKHVFVRGAPEVILAKSKISDKEKKDIQHAFEALATEGLRVIGFGTRTISEGEAHTRASLETALIFLGYVGIYDPPRKEAKEAVAKARGAGIHTVMVTGDNELTALAIGKEIGLIDAHDDVLTGEALQKLSDEEVKPILGKVRIFARTQPEDKLRLVNLYKELGYVVGVTGDGVNDALALKRADVGIAMGASGTDVAKEASDIVLLDDNFHTLVRAVEEGRIIYNNIVKAIIYLLAGNLSELSLIFFGALLGVPSPLLPTQILWINIVTDGLPALALASDTQNDTLLQTKPRDPHEEILTQKRILFIVTVGFSMSLLTLAVFVFLLRSTSDIVARTVVFNLLVVLHAVLVYLVRGKTKTKNTFLLWAVFGTLLIQVLITTTPFFQDIFHLGFK